jgi:hypothetical protein
MAVTSDDELYFADTGNNRIRVISPRGIITTIAGNGRNSSWVPSGTPALKASIGGPADIAIGPGGTLYIASEGTNQILELSPAGRLLQIAGSRTLAGVTGIGQRATGVSPDGPDGLAFDRAGDLYIAGFTTKNLLMISARGRMRLPIGTVGFYPRGRGGLVTARDGSVLAMNGQQVDQITSHALRVLIDFSRHNQTGIRGFLPDGIAVTPNGTIYLDTWDGNGWASKTALIETSPNGRTTVIWQRTRRRRAPASSPCAVPPAPIPARGGDSKSRRIPGSAFQRRDLVCGLALIQLPVRQPNWAPRIFNRV